VCGPAPDMRELGAWQWYRACRKDAVDHAVASLPFNLMANLDMDSKPETLAQR